MILAPDAPIGWPNAQAPPWTLTLLCGNSRRVIATNGTELMRLFVPQSPFVALLGIRIEKLTDDDIRALLDEKHIYAHRARKLTPDAPVIRGTAQNPDVYFQARETDAQRGAAYVLFSITERGSGVLLTTADSLRRTQRLPVARASFEDPKKTQKVGFLGVEPQFVTVRKGLPTVGTVMWGYTVATTDVILHLPQRMVDVAKAAVGAPRKRRLTVTDAPARKALSNRVSKLSP